MAEYILSAFADEVSPEFDKQLEYLKHADIKFIEPRNIDGTNVSSLTLDQAKNAKAKMDKYGIGVSSIGSPVGKVNIVTDDLDAHMKLFEHTLDLAEIFESKNIRMFSFFYPEGHDAKEYRSEILEQLSLMLCKAEKRGINLCHENEARIYGESPEYCLDLMQALDGKMKSVLDMGNFAFCKQDAYKGYDMLKDYIEYIHIKDAFYDTRIVPAGKGDGQVKKILDSYNKMTDRKVFLTLEPHLTLFSGLSNLSNMEDISVEDAYETPEIAFDTAAAALRTILSEI